MWVVVNIARGPNETSNASASSCPRSPTGGKRDIRRSGQHSAVSIQPRQRARHRRGRRCHTSKTKRRKAKSRFLAQDRARNDNLSQRAAPGAENTERALGREAVSTQQSALRHGKTKSKTKTKTKPKPKPKPNQNQNQTKTKTKPKPKPKPNQNLRVSAPAR
jgi:hypothetical protein